MHHLNNIVATQSNSFIINKKTYYITTNTNITKSLHSTVDSTMTDFNLGLFESSEIGTHSICSGGGDGTFPTIIQSCCFHGYDHRQMETKLIKCILKNSTKILSTLAERMALVEQIRIIENTYWDVALEIGWCRAHQFEVLGLGQSVIKNTSTTTFELGSFCHLNLYTSM